MTLLRQNDLRIGKRRRRKRKNKRKINKNHKIKNVENVQSGMSEQIEEKKENFTTIANDFRQPLASSLQARQVN